MKLNSQIVDIVGEDAYQKSQLKTDSDLCHIKIDYIQYYRNSKYWKYINSTIKASALHDYFSQLRGFRTAHTIGNEKYASDQPQGEYRADISEFFRDGEIVSLRSWYTGCSGATHGWCGVDCMNFGGSDCGSFTLEGLFALDGSQALKIIKRCDEILKRDGFGFGATEYKTQVSLLDEIDDTFLTATEMLEHFNFNDHGIVLDFGSAVASQAAMGEFNVTIPWVEWEFEIDQSYNQTQIAKFINEKRATAQG